MQWTLVRDVHVELYNFSFSTSCLYILLMDIAYSTVQKQQKLMKKTAKQFKIRCYRPSVIALKQQKSRRKEKETEMIVGK